MRLMERNAWFTCDYRTSRPIIFVKFEGRVNAACRRDQLKERTKEIHGGDVDLLRPDEETRRLPRRFFYDGGSNQGQEARCP